MNQIDRTQKPVRRQVSEEYFDSEGNKWTRATSADFTTLPYRHVIAISKLPGFQDDKDLVGRIKRARACYNAVKYVKALNHLNWSLKRMPALEPYIYYYIRVCEHIVAIMNEEEKHDIKLNRHHALLKHIRWPMSRIRCKWCGQNIPYVNPDVPTCGFNTFANSCISCKRMYPMPSWLWDSPDGRAYSYYRMSFIDEQFYEEFEQDYDPRPLCNRRQKKKE